MDNIIKVPVSIGEVFDKISILDIKLKYITDSRRNDVNNEFILLTYNVKDLLIKYNYYYVLIKHINEDIWHFMDKIRTINEEHQMDKWIYYCKKSIEYNDIRFRIKNKINKICCSSLTEQKSYNLNNYTIYCNNIEYLDKIIILINYNSLIYDNVIVMCNLEIMQLLKEKINDPTITYNINYDNINNININELYDVTKSNNIELFKFIENIGV